MHLSIVAFLSVLLAHSFAALPQPENQIVILPHDSGASSAIRDSLIANKIIHQVLDDFKPSWHIDVAYPKNHEQVLLGNSIPVSAVQSRPVFTFRNLNVLSSADSKDSIFTLILTDPDAKSRAKPKMSEMCHWIITNLTASAHDPSELTSLELGELVEYLPPGPPPKTGPHRYVFVLLKGKKASGLKAPAERPHWGYGKKRHGIRDWASENDLKVVGANFFFAQNEKQ